MLMALLVEMITVALRRFPTPWTAALPGDVGPRTALGVTGPVMARWSWWLLSKRRLGEMGLAVDLWARGDSCYAPLLADPLVTQRAFAARQRLLRRLGRDLEPTPAGGRQDRVRREQRTSGPQRSHSGSVPKNSRRRPGCSPMRRPSSRRPAWSCTRCWQRRKRRGCTSTRFPAGETWTVPSRLFEAVRSRLEEVDLRLEAATVSPFGRELPLVRGWVVIPPTGLLALVAECGEEWSEGAWRDVLFAISGIRHSLANDERTALGPPVLLALTADEGRPAATRVARDTRPGVRALRANGCEPGLRCAGLRRRWGVLGESSIMPWRRSCPAAAKPFAMA